MQNSSMWVKRIFAMFVLVCTLAACSALRLGYTNGDTFLYWWLHSYVGFTSAEKPWVKQHIEALFAWHRKTQLNEYARLLERVQRQLREPVTAGDVQLHYAELKQHATVALEQALPDLAEFALALNTSQLAKLEEKFASNNEHYRKDYLRGDADERQAYRFKQLMKQAEYWFGDFDKKQEAQIRAASDARPMNNELWAAERVRRQQELLQLLRRVQAERPERTAVEGWLRTYAAHSLEGFTYEQNKAFFDASRDGTAETVALLINLAAPAQRAHAVQRLQGWIDACHTLAAS